MHGVFGGFSVRVISGMKQPVVAAGSTDRPSLLPAAQQLSATVLSTSADSELSAIQRHPVSSVSSTAVTMAGVDSIAVTSGTTVSSVSTTTDRVHTKATPTAETKSTDVAATDVDRARDVASTTSQGSMSSMLTQLSYTQPSVELLRRRRDADIRVNSDTSTTSTSTPLLSSATQAALAALASTPRR